jgi:hypothetical protein
VRKSAQWIIGIMISLVALALAFRGVNVAQMAEAFRSARFVYLIPAIVFIFVGQLARAVSWKTILGGKISYWRVFAVLNEGYLLNSILPFRLGELGRAYLITRNQNLRTSQALSSVLVERVIDLCMVLAIFVTVLPQVLGFPWAREAAIVSGLLTGLAIGTLFGIALLKRAWVLLPFYWIAQRISFAKKFESQLILFLDGLEALRDGRRFLTAAIFSLLAWLCAGLTAWCLLFAYLPLPVTVASFQIAQFVLVISALGVALPSAPASMGVFEASVVAALSVFAVNGSVAFTYALTFHAVILSVTMTLGALALAREGETLAHLAQAAQALMTARVADPAGEAAPRAVQSPPQPSPE